MRNQLALLVLLLTARTASSQEMGPEVTNWILNLNGTKGYGGIPSNVQKVQFSDENVYVSCTCIPGYDIGPWAGNPNTPANQNFVFKLTRAPKPNTGTAVATPNGHIGVWRNGVSIFNAKDARSYNNQNIWNQNAIIVEGASFDDCLGHPAPNGEYHHHLNPVCLYDAKDSAVHSPIIGYAFDGYPIYGAFGFKSTEGTGGVTRMRSSYRLRSITARTTRPDGSALSANQYGPTVGGQYPLGYYIEDYEYVSGLGDLDEHNGRLTITPEYPGGTYAYFVTIDEQGNAAYPYTLGPNYYGTVPTGNTGPQSGHNTPSEPVLNYVPSSRVVGEEPIELSVYPNPAGDHIRLGGLDGLPTSAIVVDALGRSTVVSLAEGVVSVEHLPSGQYQIVVRAAEWRARGKFIK